MRSLIEEIPRGGSSWSVTSRGEREKGGLHVPPTPKLIPPDQKPCNSIATTQFRQHINNFPCLMDRILTQTPRLSPMSSGLY
ncbi:hypothetical protein EMCRGX_G029071 [Ephydatia muelleri]